MNTTVTLANAIQYAAKLREDSWQSDTAIYTKSITQASEEAGVFYGMLDKDVVLITILLITAWNNALEWAEGR